MTDYQQSIPLNKLILWSGNVRKTAGADTALAELAASIAAHGLLQSLVVRKDKRGKFAVIAGGRRLAALRSLVDAGSMASGAPIPCRVVAEDANGVELGLAENAAREDMHPADQFEAFRHLADKGMSTVDIASRFGVSENVVEKRLRLARVSPVIVKAYREGDITLDCVMAFAVTDDHTAQEKLWKDLPEVHRKPRIIRATLIADDLAASDRKVKFVGLRAYEKAGGGTRRDLFSEGDDGVFILDPALLARLADAKLEKTAKAVRKEGWKWVEIEPAFGDLDTGAFERRYPEPVPLSSEEAAELAALDQEADAIFDIEGDLTEEQQARLDAVTARMEELADNRDEIWPDATLAISGAVVRIGRDGKADVVRGLVRPEDMAQGEPQPALPDAAGPVEAGPPGLPSALVESLTTERSAALTAELMNAPAAALAAIVHAFALRVFHRHDCDASSLQVDVTPRRLEKAEGSRAFAAIEDARKAWTRRLPDDPSDLWAWCMEQRTDTLLELLAFCAALSMDAVITRGDDPACARIAHADVLASALGVEMSAWFQPTSENYFNKVSKKLILEALQEAKGVPPAPAWFGMKKADLAALAERELTGKNWLPALLRIVGDTGSSSIAA